jgi:mannose-6-phosphate isomerase-like protein (cupin superfamily)
MKRRKFIAAGLLSALAANNSVTEGFAQSKDGKPRAVTNKIKKGAIKPLYVKPDTNPSFISGAKIRFDQTNNQLSTWERVVQPKSMGPAPHVHEDLDEIMRVVKGKITVMVGDEIVEVEEGAWHLRPHGIVHTFWNATDEPAYVIEIYPNQNFEVFLEEFKKLMGEFASAKISPSSKEATQRIDALERQWGVVSYHDQREPLMKKYGLK